MYLKNIEVHGFKSFANKINFQFHNGITGIVGPNGSGKSNVADAVRWVLGEQRVKQLRGSNMQDVIFSGTELRKPMSYASVAITIDNSDHQLAIDYEEVTVTRRLYRSGESEYLLNGTQCRLRDINELFYDTGIGKEGYSIIGQGQIDKILSGKPEDRRELFDEAAGIVKFKRRKDTAQKKLESEKQNLVRANDILSELEKRLSPLEKQAETAKVYLKKRDELKAYDVNMFLLSLDKLKADTSQVQENLSVSNQQMQEAKDAYEETKREYDLVEEKVSQVDLNLEEKRNRLNETTVLKEQLEGRLNLLKEQIRSARMNDEHILSRLQQIQDAESVHNEEAKKVQKQWDENQQVLLGLQNQQDQLLGRLHGVQEEIEAGTQQIEDYKAEIIELLNKKASLKANRQKFDTMMEQVQIHKAELNQKYVSLQTSENQFKESVDQFEDENEKISAQIAEHTEESNSLEKTFGELKFQLAENQEKLNHKQQKAMKQRSRLESLTNLTERYDGYGNSIRKVMEKKEEEKGIIGVVADIIQTEKKYETAIETALGGSIQNIVTEDENIAKKMIRFLKENKFGRATFLPLTSIKGQSKHKDEGVLKEKGVIALASDLVTASVSCDAVKEYLLGRFYVVDHMDHAIAIAAKYKYSLRIVTLDGELLSPGGSMTGGAFKNASNLLGRRREIDELTETVKKLDNAIASIEKQIQEKKAKRDSVRGQMDAVKEKLQNLYLRHNTVKLKLAQAKAEFQSVKDQFDGLQNEKQSVELQMKAIAAQKEKIVSDMEQSSAKRKELTETIEKEQLLLEDRREEEAKYTQESVDLQVECANVMQKAEFLQQNLQRIQEEVSVLCQEKDSLLEGVDASKEDVRRKEDNLDAVTEGIEKAKEQIALLQTELASMQQQREEFLVSNRSFFDKREELSQRINLLDREIFRLTSQLERLEDSREAQISYMWEEYELTYSSALELRNEEYADLTDMRKQIKRLKDEIKNLGNVNVNAIEEYKETIERYDFLKVQRDDLVKAEETLLGIIAELDEGMRKQFTEKFAQIKVEFDKAFKDLFGGGKGTLELVEEEDVLDAGIRIISQPPGKKLQNMMQLSGGEKALTAIALLFAIQNLKPSPFCLLDEIEAALDDSNVDRFANYLHKLTNNTQFIMITHRRGTMAAADRLYGITMQEKGVSTLVSVNLIEQELDQ